MVTPAPKVAPLPAQAFIHFKTLAMACINFTITTLIRLTGALCPVLCRKTSLLPNHFRIGGKSDTRTATAMHFHANAGLIFLTDELTNDRYLVDTGATLSIVPCSPSGPLLKGTDGQPIPSWGFIQKTVQFQGKLSTATFLQAAVAGPILDIDYLRKFEVTVSPEIKQIQFACFAAASPSPFCLRRPRMPNQYFQWPCPPRLFYLA
jgi:hypothetical protein